MAAKVKQGFECINEELGWKRLPGASHWRKDFGGVIVDCWNTTGKARVVKIGKGIKVPFICAEGMVCSGVEALQLMANLELLAKKQKGKVPATSRSEVVARAPLKEYQATEINSAYAAYEESMAHFKAQVRPRSKRGY